MALAVIVPVAPLNAPVPPVTLPLNVLKELVVVNVAYSKPPLVSSAAFTVAVVFPVTVKYTTSLTYLPATAGELVLGAQS